MMWKINPLLPCVATVLTLGIVPEVQAARLIPVPTATEIGRPADTFDGSGFLTQNGTARINNISVMTIPNVTSTVYDVCFEFGTYTSVFRTMRDPACITTILPGTPEFLNKQGLATIAAGGPDPNNGMPTSDGMLTALINAFNSSSQVIQVIGNFVDTDGMVYSADDDPNFYPMGSKSFIIPYAYNAGTTTIQGVQVGYNTTSGLLDGEWMILNPTFSSSTADTQALMYARFGFVRDIDLNPPPAGVPEPSGVFGVFLAGFSLLVTTRRR